MKKIFFLVVGVIFLVSFVSASFGLDNTDVPSLRDPIITSTSTTNTTSVNNSLYWMGMGAINTTQMENNGGTLNINKIKSYKFNKKH